MLTKEMLLVDVPEGVSKLYFSPILNRVTYFTKIGDLHTFDIPLGISVKWLKLATEVSEEEAAELVERGRHQTYGKCYKNYEFDESNPENDHGNPRYYRYAKTALLSLCRSQSKDPNKTIVVKISSQ